MTRNHVISSAGMASQLEVAHLALIVILKSLWDLTAMSLYQDVVATKMNTVWNVQTHIPCKSTRRLANSSVELDKLLVHVPHVLILPNKI